MAENKKNKDRSAGGTEKPKKGKQAEKPAKKSGNPEDSAGTQPETQAGGQPYTVSFKNTPAGVSLGDAAAMVCADQCAKAMLNDDIKTASLMIAELFGLGAYNMISTMFQFAEQNQQQLSFGMKMMINGCVDHFLGCNIQQEALALLEGRLDGDLPV